ncbi:hypothetical protein ACFP9V_11530 [Deinococcus radiopugnans]|uniref:Uncharacterized protein n=1 Tax=Deinococcus radiopugnans ATCC 19172 TaxID=585398 RepID=A0A5C4YB43_9DEIO|nr:hypothetical protein [Deinococcus radiopugnans]MBB6015971.1 hypothetical protein [Deinococcus radiopugnans ATCC 19172]TNM72341.1 hypothetical protein FHR04_03315 [Deinococcus radiopugnans ATCC 19172]
MTNVPHPFTVPVPPMLRDRWTPSVGPETELFGVLVLEAVKPSEDAEVPAPAEWEIRVWPVARLGDVTIEAQPLRPWLGADDLRTALQAAGWTPLGPIRVRRGLVEGSCG